MVDVFNLICGSIKIKKKNKYNASVIFAQPPEDAKVYEDTTLEK